MLILRYLSHSSTVGETPSPSADAGSGQEVRAAAVSSISVANYACTYIVHSIQLKVISLSPSINDYDIASYVPKLPTVPSILFLPL